MLIGAHVSPAGGPANAIDRGVERGCRSIQIFNQSPRQWKPTVYDDEKVAAYKEAFAASDIDAALLSLTRARYGRVETFDGSALDEALATAARASDRVAARHTWIAETMALAGRSLSGLLPKAWAR